MIRPEGAGGWIAKRKMKRRSVTDCLSPSQGGFMMSITLGLKPQVESFYAFGINSLSFEAQPNYPAKQSVAKRKTCELELLPITVALL